MHICIYVHLHAFKSRYYHLSVITCARTALYVHTYICTLPYKYYKPIYICHAQKLQTFSTKTTIVSNGISSIRSQCDSQIVEAQIYSKLHSNNIFIY